MLAKGAYVLIPELGQMDDAIGHVTKHKNMVLSDFLTTYANLFCSQKANGEVHYDNERFREAVREVLLYRRRLRRNAQGTENGQDEDPSNPARCLVM